LGRVVVPIELRRMLGIEAGDELSITVDGDRLVFRKLMEGCVICGREDELAFYRERAICKECLEGFQPAD
jgi:AbrB family transcriptional regulator, transcriptional pleiotropic regulator of transition state genes